MTPDGIVTLMVCLAGGVTAAVLAVSVHGFRRSKREASAYRAAYETVAGSTDSQLQGKSVGELTGLNIHLGHFATSNIAMMTEASIRVDHAIAAKARNF